MRAQTYLISGVCRWQWVLIVTAWQDWGQCKQRVEVKRENKQEATNSMFIIKFSISTCFGHHYAHHQENKTVSYCMRCSDWVCWLWSSGAASWAVCTVWKLMFDYIESLIINIELVASCWFSLFTLFSRCTVRRAFIKNNFEILSCVLLKISLAAYTCPYTCLYTTTTLNRRQQCDVTCGRTSQIKFGNVNV